MLWARDGRRFCAVTAAFVICAAPDSAARAGYGLGRRPYRTFLTGSTTLKCFRAIPQVPLTTRSRWQHRARRSPEFTAIVHGPGV